VEEGIQILSLFSPGSFSVIVAIDRNAGELRLIIHFTVSSSEFQGYFMVGNI
jgi:hypothetical protein